MPLFGGHNKRGSGRQGKFSMLGILIGVLIGFIGGYFVREYIHDGGALQRVSGLASKKSSFSIKDTQSVWAALTSNYNGEPRTAVLADAGR
jgi:hypothetical protein